jgi:hypothetical protein
VSCKLHVPADLLLGKEHRYPSDRKLDGLQSQFGFTLSQNRDHLRVLLDTVTNLYVS